MKLQYQFLSRTKFTKLEDPLYVQTPHMGRLTFILLVVYSRPVVTGHPNKLPFPEFIYPSYEEVSMTQLQKVRPTLSLVADIRDPDPALIAEAEWTFSRAMATDNREEAEKLFLSAFRHILWLVEDPFNPDSKLKPARRAFYKMRDAYEARFGTRSLPQPIFTRARAYNLVKAA